MRRSPPARYYDPGIETVAIRPSRAIAACFVAASLLFAACTVDDRKVALEDSELLTATYAVEPLGTVDLVDGKATVRVRGTDIEVRLATPVVKGDMDGDELADAALLLDLEDEEGNIETWLTVVQNRFGTPEPLPAVPVGRNILIEETTTDDGRLVLQQLDRSDGASSDTVDMRRTVAFSVVDGATTIVSDEHVLFADMPPASSEIASQGIQLSGARTATLEGRLEPDQQARYTVSVERGERLDLGLEAPLGVYLTVSAGDTVLVPPGAVAAQVASQSARELTVHVRNMREEAHDYRMAVEVSRKPPPPPPVEHKVAYLTFDDGPHGVYTPQILDVLKKHGAKATFFVLGSQAQAHPELIDRIVSEGHVLANHTWNHPDLAGKSDQFFEDEVIRTQTLLGDRGTACLRPPYGSANDTTRRQAESAGLRLVMWTVDTNDWRLPGASTIAQRIVNGMADGANVLMHDGGGDRSQTVAGVDRALTELTAAGWKFRPAC